MTHCWSAVGIAVATATVVAFITGVLAGIIAYHYINKHQLHTTKSESSSHQQQQPAGPVYEEVFATSAKEKLELKANVAYGPVQHWFGFYYHKHQVFQFPLYSNIFICDN